MMSSGSLTALAVLKVNADQLGSDYLSNFVLLVAEALRRGKDDVVSLPAIQELIKKEFALDLPLNPLRQILKRAAKQNFVTKEHDVYYRNLENCSKSGFSERQQLIAQLYERVVRRLQEFANTRGGQNWEEKDAEQALETFLSKYSLKLLFAIVERTDLDVTDAYVVGAFISDVARQDGQLMRDLETLAQGSLLANVIYLPDPGKIAQKFENTKVYLDTAVLVYAAGFAGPERAAPVLELLKLLRDYDADLKCFTGTTEEIRGILDACAHRLRTGNLKTAFGASLEYFIETGKSASDVELMSARLPATLKRLGIQVDEKPSFSPELYKIQIDEKGFEAALSQEIRYSNPKALVHDVECISAIARLRGGLEAFVPELSRALFITTNASLAWVTRGFFQAEASPGAVSFCLTDYSLGSLLWLKNPTKVPDLPSKRLLADAYAATQPPEGLWKKYLIEVAKLEAAGKVTSEEYYLLRHSTAARGVLMDITKGAAEVFAEGTAQDVLKAALESVRADLHDGLKEERERSAEMERKLVEAQQREYERDQAITTRAKRVARTVIRPIFWLLLVTTIVGTMYSFPWGFAQPGMVSYVVLGALIVLFMLTLANLIWGTTIESVMERCEDQIAMFVSSTIRRLSS
jgi:hypothetical protein